MTKKILSIIPARGGSKGLARKNILKLRNKPLIAWTIEASLNSKYITETVVTSDDDEILKISKECGAAVLKRPKQLATDSASSEVVVEHVLASLNEKFDYLVLLQPTSPLRDEFDIDSSFERLLKSNATALISVCEIDNKVLKAFKHTEDGFLVGLSNSVYPFKRRQDLPPVYLSNGSIYIINVDEFIKRHSFLTDKTISFVMDEIKSLDIDSKEDLDRINSVLNQNINLNTY